MGIGAHKEVQALANDIFELMQEKYKIPTAIEAILEPKLNKRQITQWMKKLLSTVIFIMLPRLGK